jgi:hypothetical protein
MRDRGTSAVFQISVECEHRINRELVVPKSTAITPVTVLLHLETCMYKLQLFEECAQFSTF